MLDPCTTALAPGVADRRTAWPYRGMAKYRHPVAISCHPNLRRTMSGNDNLASLAIQMFFEDQQPGGPRKNGTPLDLPAHHSSTSGRREYVTPHALALRRKDSKCSITN